MKHVLVTGACGLVGTAVVDRMAADGWQVTATDLDIPANRKAVARRRGPGSPTYRWGDLTNSSEVAVLLKEAQPDVVVHLAAVIPPTCYAAPRVARAVNVGAVEILVAAAERLARPPRLVMASSVAVYGARNPHRDLGLLTVDTPPDPADSYGQHKTEAEAILRASSLEFVVLRLGGVLTVEAGTAGNEALEFGAMLPADGRIQTVDVRDVATAFAAASAAPVVGETFLIGGDDSHRRVQGEIGSDIIEAMGLAGALPVGRPGNPDDDTSWFATDWMDTASAQAALDFQHHTWDGMLAEIRERAGWKRPLLRVLTPVVRVALARRSPYRGAPGTYADLWGKVRAKWGEPAPDPVG
ncbi:NAD-dependent epimerase/dehydratase family protein [Nocardioides humilatus]|uniref:NAD-dependent epimerase/dehydratase family protein n=1 Tax=Nocardioides humilatus TaxID=2607660 RepID=UPI001CB6FADD|nr:NAD(P)-dependent oxidoreductase [Nocardioides humilatus]